MQGDFGTGRNAISPKRGATWAFNGLKCEKSKVSYSVLGRGDFLELVCARKVGFYAQKKNPSNGKKLRKGCKQE